MRTIRTPEKRKKFLEALRQTGTVTHACEAAGIGKNAVYEWRNDDPEFRREWEEAIEAVADDLEKEAKRRAVEGSDTLLIFLLKAHRPERFSDRVKQEIRTTVSIENLLEQADFEDTE